MSYVMKIFGTAFEELPEPEYLKSYDPDAYLGAGKIVTTKDRASALKFADAWSVMEEWKKQSTVVPLRMDGKPNRPLSAFTISPEPVEE
jgi:hypothetical protein